MPALFSLGQHQALQAAHEQLQAGETLYAFLDDIYVTVSPERVRPVYDLLSEQLFNHTGIRLNTGKTRVWNGAGQLPPNLTSLGSVVAGVSQHNQDVPLVARFVDFLLQKKVSVACFACPCFICKHSEMGTCLPSEFTCSNITNASAVGAPLAFRRRVVLSVIVTVISSPSWTALHW